MRKDDVYCQTEEEYELAVEEAVKNGYTFDKMYKHDGPKVTRKNRGESTGAFCVIDKEYRFGKCGHCGAIISHLGIYAHGRKCEKCGRVVHLDFKKGDFICFIFQRDKNRPKSCGFDGLAIKLKVAKYDVNKKLIFFYPEIPSQKGKYWGLEKEGVELVLERNKEFYKIGAIKKGGAKKYICVRYKVGRADVINTIEIQGPDGQCYTAGMKNSTVVKIWDGVEHKEYSNFHIKETYHIYKDWLRKKNVGAMCSRVGMTSDPNYYSGSNGDGGFDADRLLELHGILLQYHGQSAADNFVSMIESIPEFSASSFLINFHKLEANGYKFTPVKKEKTDRVRAQFNGNTLLSGELGIIMSPGFVGKMFNNLFGSTTVSKFLSMVKCETVTI